jgi:uncharacterized protein (TIGR02145 family)
LCGRALLVLAAAMAVGLAGCENGDDNGGEHVHDWGEWEVTTQATCDAPGVETRICKIDNTHKETREIAQLTGAGCNYESVTIGGKTWMKKNLNIKTADSWCYMGNTANCDKYGRLYTWAAAMSACPLGWHLPTRDEWGALAEAAGGTGDYGTEGTAGKKLKSITGWPSNYGTDDYGFSALPGGERWTGGGGTFEWAGDIGYWWTATQYSSGTAYYRRMYFAHDIVDEGYENMSYGLSVRCVQE